jgi:hypothetical protein
MNAHFFAFSRSPMSGLGSLINSGHRQNSLQYSAEANEHHEQLKQIRQPAVVGELVDGPKANCAHDDDSQNRYQN